MLIELTSETILKNPGTGQRMTLERGQIVDLPGQIAEKIVEKGKARAVAGKSLQVSDTCLKCTDFNCYSCPHGCKVGLIIGKQYPAEQIFH